MVLKGLHPYTHQSLGSTRLPNFPISALLGHGSLAPSNILELISQAQDLDPSGLPVSSPSLDSPEGGAPSLKDSTPGEGPSHKKVEISRLRERMEMLTVLPTGCGRASTAQGCSFLCKPHSLGGQSPPACSPCVSSRAPAPPPHAADPRLPTRRGPCASPPSSYPEELKLEGEFRAALGLLCEAGGLLACSLGDEGLLWFPGEQDDVTEEEERQ